MRKCVIVSELLRWSLMQPDAAPFQYSALFCWLVCLSWLWSSVLEPGCLQAFTSTMDSQALDVLVYPTFVNPPTLLGDGISPSGKATQGSGAV